MVTFHGNYELSVAIENHVQRVNQRFLLAIFNSRL